MQNTTQMNGDKTLNQLPSSFNEYIVDYDETPWANSYEKLMRFRDSQSVEFQKKINDSLEIFNKIFDKYKLEDILLSFNGGKDCTILLHLFRCCVDQHFRQKKKIFGFYVLSDNEFPKLQDFVIDVSEKYNLEIEEIKACLKAGLCQIKDSHPNVVAILMGSRSTDPKSRYMKSNCEWTDADWPRFLRVCPIFDWSYSDVWRALRGLSVPYFHLYNLGYTSLGERNKTFPNPVLLTKDNKYLPAYHLNDECLERSSRD